MTKKLKNLVIENVGLVDLGANQLADMAIWKRAPTVAKIGQTITVAHGDTVLKYILPKEPAHG